MIPISPAFRRGAKLGPFLSLCFCHWFLVASLQVLHEVKVTFRQVQLIAIA